MEYIMANRHLLIKDIQENTCQYIGYVGEDIDDLITNNVNEMLNAKLNVQIETLDRYYSVEDLENSGWKHDQSLYETLLMKYTEATNKTLKRWR